MAEAAGRLRSQDAVRHAQPGGGVAAAHLTAIALDGSSCSPRPPEAPPQDTAHAHQVWVTERSATVAELSTCTVWPGPAAASAAAESSRPMRARSSSLKALRPSLTTRRPGSPPRDSSTSGTLRAPRLLCARERVCSTVRPRRRGTLSSSLSAASRARSWASVSTPDRSVRLLVATLSSMSRGQCATPAVVPRRFLEASRTRRPGRLRRPPREMRSELRTLSQVRFGAKPRPSRVRRRFSWASSHSRESTRARPLKSRRSLMDTSSQRRCGHACTPCRDVRRLPERVRRTRLGKRSRPSTRTMSFQKKLACVMSRGSPTGSASPVLVKSPLVKSAVISTWGMRKPWGDSSPLVRELSPPPVPNGRAYATGVACATGVPWAVGGWSSPVVWPMGVAVARAAACCEGRKPWGCA
mmetsp:Transcript_13322/g.39244  ORF Transcript_13322/g.39244 Transcript_13322/m.39244 type:complete len:412 (+) Transcript_13322:225-1460(+)